MPLKEITITVNKAHNCVDQSQTQGPLKPPPPLKYSISFTLIYMFAWINPVTFVYFFPYLRDPSSFSRKVSGGLDTSIE